MLKRLVEGSRGFGEPEKFDVFNADLVGCRLLLQDSHRLIDEVWQRHHARVGGGAARGEIRGDGRWDDFDDLDRRIGQLHPQGKRVGVQRRFGCAVGRRDRQRRGRPAKS